MSKINYYIYNHWIKLRNFLWEQTLGINTRGVVKEDIDPDSFCYSTISYSAIFSILNRLDLKSSDVFYDIGSGKGRVACCAARFNLKKVIGVELNIKLCNIAKQNAALLKGGKTKIEIANVLAQEYDYHDGTIFYLFNPFGASTLSSVLSKIDHALCLYPRTIRIIYVNPGFDSLLSNSNWLEMYDKWAPNKYIGLNHSVSFWRSKPK
jgi:SAM-dependent methyltransferase